MQVRDWRRLRPPIPALPASLILPRRPVFDIAIPQPGAPSRCQQMTVSVLFDTDSPSGGLALWRFLVVWRYVFEPPKRHPILPSQGRTDRAAVRWGKC